MIAAMASNRRELLDQLETHYRSHGWPVECTAEGTLLAAGPGGVLWHGTVITPDDLISDGLELRLADLAHRRMPRSGELCPLDLLASEECEAELRQVLDGLGLSRRPHVSVYSVSA